MRRAARIDDNQPEIVAALWRGQVQVVNSVSEALAAIGLNERAGQ